MRNEIKARALACAFIVVFLIGAFSIHTDAKAQELSSVGLNISWQPNPADENIDFYQLEMRVSGQSFMHTARLQSKADNRCVVLNDQGRFEMEECDLGVSQLFYFRNSSRSGYATIQSRWFGRCLSLNGSSNNTPVTAETCNDVPAQQFRIQTVGDAQRINTIGGVLDAHAQNGSLVQWGWIGGNNQQWYYSDYARPNDWERLGHVLPETDDDGRVRTERIVGSVAVGTEMCFRIQAISGSDRSEYSDISCAMVAPMGTSGGGDTTTPPATVTLTTPTGLNVLLQLYPQQGLPNDRVE